MEMKNFKLVAEAFALDEYGDGPAFAEIDVDQEFLDRLLALSRVCADNGLESLTVTSSPRRWDGEDELCIVGDSLRVWGDEFWFEAHPKHMDYNVETRGIAISELIRIAHDGESGSAPETTGHACFLWLNGVLFHSSFPEELADRFMRDDNHELEGREP
jgi:hypothetical protein